MNKNGKTAVKTAKPSPRSGHALPVGAHPGNTGGKKGRSGRLPDKIKELCRELIDKHSLMEQAADIAIDKKQRASDRLSAIRLLAEYGYGKPPQYVEMENELNRETDSEELIEQLQQRLARMKRPPQVIT